MFVLLLLLVFVPVTNAFFLPGVTPTTYHEGDEIKLFVNHLTPSRYYQHRDKDGHVIKSDKEHYLYSYDYYYEKLHFCRPEHVVEKSESLGSVLFGDRIYNSAFELKMLDDKECVSLCKSTVPADDAVFINQLIKNGFLLNWIVDGLPAGVTIYNEQQSSNHITNGFPLGYVESVQGIHGKRMISNALVNIEVPYLMNHFDIEIQYHEPAKSEYRITGVVVTPKSIKRQSATCDFIDEPLSLAENQDTEVYYTYSVKYTRYSRPWGSRWDNYTFAYDTTIQWFSLINCTIVVLGLSAVVIHMLMRALRNDMARYNELNLDNFQEDSGWKLNHGDVFRTPDKPLLLSVLVGSGVQLLLCVIAAVVTGAVELYNHDARDTLPTIWFILYAVFGFVGSFTSMGVYKSFKGPYWKMNMLLSPLLVPLGILLVVMSLNIFLLFVHSSDAVPASAFFAVILTWFVLSIPLSFAGSLIALKKCSWDEHPTKTNQIARQIPFQPWYLKTLPASLMDGIFPFASIAVELYFIYSSLWFHQFFYMFGFLMLSVLLLTLTTALTTLINIYHSLCLENWKWQWKSFIIGGFGCALYVFIHSILFAGFKFRGFTTIILYLGYSLLISFLCCLITGAIGFLSSMFFVRKIYASIKID
ncbi:hypothetical protein HG537_0H02010 [Torulaspora globosa]|uniref:Transmembrane 9 superfamily member n=1 Tax=Torulaspora globosa TaxID=48254 RepID=A0A7H9HZ52_9SACH|nr:hypothetical protein HG537_0H02010 [Torulaspora sp. CBS 2947]